MAKESTRPFHVNMPDSLLKDIDDWRRHQPDIPARSEALRRLVRLALDAQKKDRPRR